MTNQTETGLDLSEIADFFSEAVDEHGATPRGVDWNGPEPQARSMAASLQLFGDEREFSVTDLGCGYGPLYAFMRQRGFDPEYWGVDISAKMIAQAQHIYRGNPRTQFQVAAGPTRPTDYIVAGGIFAKRIDIDDTRWEEYIHKTIAQMDQYSERGFAFNCLTSYSDPDKKRPDLYYADPCWLFDLCKRTYSRNVALLHDYQNWEFTIIVRK